MNSIWILATFLVLLTQALLGERSEFPLEKGTFWVYDGNVAWVAPNTTEVQRRTINWRMEIIDVISRDLVIAAVVKGHPRDLISFDPKREPGVSVIVQVHLRKHYLLEGERAQAVLKRVKDPSDLLSDLVRESEVFLETPISLGQRFCQAEMSTRTDWRNCWFVEEERTPSVKSIPGVPADWDGPEYGIAYRSLPSSEFVSFAPGIGLTSYDFSHHETSSYVQLKLTAFGRRESQ
jgi:hypothetical protein